MSNKRINVIWSASLLVITIATLITSISLMIGVTLPDILKICIGVIELIAVFVLSYTSIKKRKIKE